MPKIFKRGELKQALLAIVGSLREAHGYAIMQELERRVGRGWKPSPGAIYPALVILEDEKLLSGEDRGGMRVYRLTNAGEQLLEAQATPRVWHTAGRRLEAARPAPTAGKLLDSFARGSLWRKTELTDAQVAEVSAALAEAGDKINEILTGGDDDG